MKKKFILFIPVVAIIGTMLWGRGSYDTSDRLSTEDEATLAACNFVSRDRNTFSDNYEDTINEQEALLGSWLEFPSHDFKDKVDSARAKPSMFEYRSALCEEALQRIITDMGGGTRFLSGRCKALAADHEYFLSEYKGKDNNYLKARRESTPVTSAERYWCNGRGKTDLMKIACSAREIKRDAYNQNSSAYKDALSALKKRCGPYIGEPRRELASNGDLVDRGPFLSQGSTHGSGVVQSNNGPIVVRRYIQAPSGQWGGCAGSGVGNGLNVIQFKPSITHTIMSGLVAGFGAYLSYDGQKRVDEQSYKLTKHVIDTNASLGAATLYAGGGASYWGQNGGAYPYPYGQVNGPNTGGGMCGRPPFNTAYTGCLGGMPGQPIIGGQHGMCPGGQCGMIAGGSGAMCPPGVPCQGGMIPGGPGGFQGGCPPGYPNCGAGQGGCPGGNCQNYPGNYMNNPAMMNNPNQMYGQNPYNLELEKQRLQQLQNEYNKRLEDARRAQEYNQQLADLRNKQNALNNQINTTQMGYNGLLANQFGPATTYGNPGMYQGPGMPNAGGCGGSAGGGTCGCASMVCYPGQPSAYYSPPYVYGNSGLGGTSSGYPSTNNGFFGINLRWTGVRPNTGTFNAR
ncbi:MAG: hypothetical protein R3A80_12505 [Bdellovibrionota bacterium]